MAIAEEPTAQTHYPSLDGLRGFAAISVLLFHFNHWLNVPWLAMNGGLAVDLFFCLSGYVLPLAYQRRTLSLSTANFLHIRLIRLMPLIVVAIAISAPYVVFRNKFFGLEIPYGALTASIMLGLLNLPYFGAPNTIGGPQLFPLNGPQYTLFLELFVNILWWSTRRINQLWLSMSFAVASLLLLALLGIGGDVPETFWSGFPHVGAPFFLGVAIFCLDNRITPWRGWTVTFWGLVGLMIVLFYIPIDASFIVRMIWMAVISPLLVISGSRAQLSKHLNRICLLGGALSYPIYCLHYPLFCWINGVYLARFGAHDIATEGPVIVVLVFTFCFIVLKFYDEPLRRHLTRRRRGNQPASYRVQAIPRDKEPYSATQ